MTKKKIAKPTDPAGRVGEVAYLTAGQATPTVSGEPPHNTPILFVAGEYGQPDTWYAGFCWQSIEPGQALKFYIYPWFVGMPPYYPPFNAPPYRGRYRLISDPAVLEYIASYEG